MKPIQEKSNQHYKNPTKTTKMARALDKISL